MSPASPWDRDPFAPGFDRALWWETPEREQIRKRIVVALGSARPVWVTGEVGSGRGALVERVAADLGARGRPVLFTRGACPEGAEACLDRWLSAIGEPTGGTDALVRAIRLYGRLLDRFASAGTVVVIPSTAPLSGEALEEASILAGLAVAGSPLSVPLVIGPGPGPERGWTEVVWPSASPTDLRAMVSHRLAACGGSDTLASIVIDSVSSATGFAQAVAAARDALDRLRFDPGPAPTEGGTSPTGRPVLDPAQVGEVDGLLAELSDEP